MSTQRILFSNLGERNLLFQTEAGWRNIWQIRGKEDTPTFRQQTEDLITTHPKSDWPELIKANILDTLLEMDTLDHDSITDLVLFTSNQPRDKVKADERGKDTLHAGPLLKAWLEVQPAYSHIQVHLEELPVSVVESDELAKQFRQILRKWRAERPGHTYVICDAGGTGQQKNALKLMAEYLLPEERIEAYYVAKVEGKSVPQKAHSVEFRRVVAGVQIQPLLRQLNYRAAQTIYGKPEHDDEKEKQALRLMEVAHLRAELRYEDARQLAKLYRADLDQANMPTWRDYAERKAHGTIPGWASQCFSTVGWWKVVEAYGLLQHHWQQNSEGYTRLVQVMQRFVETYLNQHLDHSHRRQHLPFKLDKARQTQVPEHQAIVQQFDRMIQGGQRAYRLNTLRNRIAHDGKGVKEADFLRVAGVPEVIDQWRVALGLPDLSPYQEINQKIMTLLQ